MRFQFRWPAVVTLLLAACGGGDSPAPVPQVTFSASPLSVSNAAGATLTWNSTNASSCSASGGWSGSLPTSGTRSTGPLSTSTSYVVVCSGDGGTSVPASATVNVVPTATLAANPTVVAAGGTSQLTWTSSNATACQASGGWGGAEAQSGTQSTAALGTNTTFSLTCSGPGGSSDPVTATVNVVPNAVLTASPTTVAAGAAAVLTWSSTNATACTASGGWSGSKSASGTQGTGAISAATTYTLACTGPGGTSKFATVTVMSGSVTVTPSLAAVTFTQRQQFSAAASGVGSLTWSVDGIPAGNATMGTVSASGLYTPGSAAGRHTISAGSADDPSIAGSAVAAVTDLSGVYTYHNDVARDGVNTQEYALTPATVNTTSFGKLFSCTVDGAVYAQPLWVASLSSNGAKHNVVFVATEHDSLYAFDADASPCSTLWSASMIDATHGGLGGETSVPSGVPGYLVGRGGNGLTPEVGVTGTPVIDPATGTLYLISKSANSGGTTIYQRLHAIDLTTGSEKAGSPVTIAAAFPGSGDGGTSVTFNPGPENQRAGLALVNGVIYITWAAHEDVAPWYGWVIGYSYSGTAFTQTAVFNAAPDFQESGIWMGGAPPSSDSTGNLYLITGNGTFNVTGGTAPNRDYGDSLLQMTPALTVSQYFTPSDQAADQLQDKDFGGGGAAVLADLPAGSSVPHLLICGGKDGVLYMLNRDALGGAGDSAAVQMIAFGNPIYATGAFWNGNFYIGGDSGPLTQFGLNTTIPHMALASTSSHVYGFAGSTPSISAAALQNGVVWTLDNAQFCTGNATPCGPTVLYAHDAANVASELWNSAADSADAAGTAVKFTVPTVANGKVYVGTRGNNAGGVSGSTTIAGELDVYGLRQ